MDKRDIDRRINNLVKSLNYWKKEKLRYESMSDLSDEYKLKLDKNLDIIIGNLNNKLKELKDLRRNFD